MTEEERVRWRGYLLNLLEDLEKYMKAGYVLDVEYEQLFFNPFEHTADFLPGLESYSPQHNMEVDLQHMLDYLLQQLEKEGTHGKS